MNKQIVGVVVVLALIVVGGGFYFYGDALDQSQQAEEQAGIANPASTNCVTALGGTLEIKEGEGGQYGVCHLPDGRACEEWALFRDGTCVSGE